MNFRDSEQISSVVSRSAYAPDEPKDTEAEDQCIVRFSIVVGNANMSVFEKVSFPTV